MRFPQGTILKASNLFRVAGVAICVFSLLTVSFAQIRGSETKTGRTSVPTITTKADVETTNVTTAQGPFFIPGDPSCKLLNDLEDPEYAHITEDWELKLEIDVPNGQFPMVTNYELGVIVDGGLAENPNIFLNIGSTGSAVNFWSIGPANLLDRAVSAIIILGSPAPGGHIYTYPNLSVGDTGPFLTPGGFDVTGVKFCMEAFSGPSSAPASISGRAITMGGVGVGNARIEVLNLVTGVKRTGTTNNFGYYIVDGLSAADLYMVTISHRRHQFFDPQRTVTLDSDISGVDFVTVW